LKLFYEIGSISERNTVGDNLWQVLYMRSIREIIPEYRKKSIFRLTRRRGCEMVVDLIQLVLLLFDTIGTTINGG